MNEPGIEIRHAINGSICKLNPTAAGESIAELYNEASPTSKTPLVLLIDEYDNMLRAAHTCNVTRASKTRTLVLDKSSHNSHMDDLRLYPNLIVIRTTNTPKSALDAWDPSYLREGRINAYFVCKTAMSSEERVHMDAE